MGLSLAGAVFLAESASALTNVYSTRFEASEGYNPGLELIGQKGWITDSSSFGGNGLLTNFVGTQAAFIGFHPLDPVTDYLALWQPINYAPLQDSNPVVRFTVTMSITDSSTTNWDDFYWSVYNNNGDNLFTLDFYNGDLGIYYALDDGSNLVWSGAEFTNGTVYALEIKMDFASNRWSATLDNRVVLSDKPITTRGASLTLGDVDAFWVVTDPAKPGDNYMIFDNYQVTAEISSNMPPKLISLGMNAARQYGLRLEGASGSRYAIDATTNLLQWTALTTNTATNAVFEFRDTASPTPAKRHYRGRLVR